jgi:hypothetical protein
MGARSLRYLTAPIAARVTTDGAGTPCAVIAGGRALRVATVREDWLVHDRWWTDQPVDRHYFELLCTDGRVQVVFCDTPTGGWFAYP